MARQTGIAPAVALWNPQYAHNVGAVLRSCSCYKVKQLWWSGSRVTLDVPKGGRLPREERMKGYRDVEMVRDDRIFDAFPRSVTPVAIEVRENSESLIDFIHPDNPLFVFGPEDGSIPSHILQHCHRFVTIPTAHCLNLATAVSTVLYDWTAKRVQSGLQDELMPDVEEERGFIDGADVFSGISLEGYGRKYAARKA